LGEKEKKQVENQRIGSNQSFFLCKIFYAIFQVSLIPTCTDLHVEVVPVSHEELASDKPSERSAEIRKRVVAAREIQKRRFEGCQGVFANAQMSSRMVREYCRIDEAGQLLLKQAMDRLGLSARAYDRILKVARTIADLDGSPDIEIGHLSEAINFRNLDRDNWGRR